MLPSGESGYKCITVTSFRASAAKKHFFSRNLEVWHMNLTLTVSRRTRTAWQIYRSKVILFISSGHIQTDIYTLYTVHYPDHWSGW